MTFFLCYKPYISIEINVKIVNSYQFFFYLEMINNNDTTSCLKNEKKKNNLFDISINRFKLIF